MSETNKKSNIQLALDELKCVNNVIDRINRVRESNHVMSLVLSELIKITDSQQGVINLVSCSIDQEMQTVIRKQDQSIQDIPFKVHNMLSGWVLSHKQMLKIDDLDKDERFSELSSDDGMYKSILCFPMIVSGDVIGLTTLVKNVDGGFYDDNLCRLAGIIISQSAYILKNALLFEEIAHQNELLNLMTSKLKEENLALKSQTNKAFTFENIIGKTESMKNILILVSKVSAHDMPVLICGSTGTGKELIARAIHYNSSRKDKAFVVKNCGVKTETLLESELFGHVKGAFTGAHNNKNGLFQEANGGTIFLDEIGDAPLPTQVAILRAIETGEIRPVGASKSSKVDVRVISATNKNLPNEIKANKFRQDLYYRLNTFIIDLPPLKQRTDDIPLLTEHFLSKFMVKLNREALKITPAALDILMRYQWPGNVRQLENELERAAIVAEDPCEIDVSDLSSELLSVIYSESKSSISGRLKDTVESLERQMITETLIKNANNIQKSSRILGLTRKGLKDKMKRYQIEIDN